MENEKFTEEQLINMAHNLGVLIRDGITEEAKKQIAERLALLYLDLEMGMKKK